MSNGTYQCSCHNSIGLVNAKFFSYSGGTQFAEIDLHTGGTGNLSLPQASGNTIQIQYWDVNWQSSGCVLVNDGDQVTAHGATTGFEITINGKQATLQSPCPPVS